MNRGGLQGGGMKYLKEYAINLEMQNTLPIFIPTCEYYKKANYNEEENKDIKYFVNTNKRKFNEYYGKALEDKKDGLYDSVLGCFEFDNDKDILKIAENNKNTGFYIIWENTNDEEQNGVVELDTIKKYDNSDRNSNATNKGYSYFINDDPLLLQPVTIPVRVVLATAAGTIGLGVATFLALAGSAWNRIAYMLDNEKQTKIDGTGTLKDTGEMMKWVIKQDLFSGGSIKKQKTFKLKSKNLNRSVKKRKGGGNRKVRKKIKFKKHTTAKLKSRNSNRTVKKGVRKHIFVKHKKIKLKKHKTMKLKSKSLNRTYKRT